MNEQRLLDLGFTRPDLPLVRIRLLMTLLRAGLEEPRLGAFVHAVLEVASNAVVHGGGEGRLTALAADGEVRCGARSPTEVPARPRSRSPPTNAVVA